MALTQIAQQTFTTDREDGTSLSIRLTFEQEGASAQSYNVPLEEESGVIIKQGDSGDSPIKPIKVTQAEFTLTGVDEPLIDAIVGAGEQEIRVTIEDTVSGYEYLTGFVVKGLDNRPMYGGLDRIKVKVIDSFQDLTSVDANTLPVNLTLDDLADQIGSALQTDRPLDVLSSLRHSGKLASDPLPTELRFDPLVASGFNQAGEGSLLAAWEQVLAALGWQAAVINGRLVFADLYDRFANSAAVNKHVDGGGGSYSNTSENLEVNLNDINIIDDAEYEELLNVLRYEFTHGLYTRDSSGDIISNTDQTVTKESELQFSQGQGMVIAGDVITVQEVSSPVGSGLTLNSDPAQNLTGEFGFFRVMIEDQATGTEYHYDPAADEWKQGITKYWFKQSYNFTGGGGSAQFESFSITNVELPPVPEGVIGNLWAFRTNHLITSDPTTAINGCDFDRHEVTVTEVDLGDDPTEISHIYRGNSGLKIGEVLKAFSFIADNDDYSKQQAFDYDSTGTGNWQNTTSWLSDLTDGTLGLVNSERVGTVVAGIGEGFTLRFRDLTAIDIFSVGKIVDDNGQTRTALPVEIAKDILHGFVSVEFKEVFNGLDNITDSYGFGLETESSGAVSSGGGGGGGGGGATSLNELDDVTLASPQLGNLLISDGTNFVNRDLQASDIPDLDAAKITSGQFAAAQIPSLDAGKITTGQFADAQISQSSVTQHEAALTIAASQITAFTEEVQDAAWAALTGGLQTLISVTYDDANNNVDFVVQESSINHDNLTGYVADEHVPHGTIDITAGSGLTGGGSIDADVTLSVASAGITAAMLNSNVITNQTVLSGSIAPADEYLFYDVSISGLRKVTQSAINSYLDANLNFLSTSSEVDHDQTTNFVADEHVAHSGVNILTPIGSGLTGGSDIATDVSLAIASAGVEAGMLNNNVISGLTALVSGLAPADELMISDAGAIKKMAVSVLETYMQNNLSFFDSSADVDHDQTTNFVADEHVAHSSVSILTPIGSGLTGGSDIASDVSLAIASAGVEAGNLNNNVISGLSELASGLGSTDELMVSDAGAIKRMDVSVLQTYLQNNLNFFDASGDVDHDQTTNFLADEHIAHSGVSILSGAGLTGGGNITQDRTLSVASGGITGAMLNSNVITNQSAHAGLGGLDEWLVYDVSVSGLRKITQNEVNTYLEANLGFATENTQLSEEQVQDFAWNVLTGSQQNITVAYDDANNWVTFSVPNISLTGDVTASAGFGTLSTSLASAAVQAVNLNNDVISGLTALTSGLGGTDEFMISDAGAIKKMDVSVLQTYMQNNLSFFDASSDVQHDSTTGFVADEHVAHSGVSISAGSGLTGGGTIASNRTISVASAGITAAMLNSNVISGQTATTAVAGADEFLFSDAGALRRLSVSSLQTYMQNNLSFFDASADVNHDQTTGFVANEHIDHTGVTISAGSGLTGGGNIAANRTISVASAGITSSMLNNNVISGQSNMTGIVDNDEFLISDGGVLRAVVASELSSYVSDNITFGNETFTGITINSIGSSAPLAPEFTGDTKQNRIDFSPASGSNDPAAIIHETRGVTETNTGVLHLMPSDDNSLGDYVAVHGTNDPVTMKLHTSGHAEFTSCDVGGNAVLTTGSTIDADTLDGINSTNFARTDIAETHAQITVTGLTTVQRNSDEQLRLNHASGTGSPYMSFYQSGTRRSFIQHVDSGNYLRLSAEYGGIQFRTGTGGTEVTRLTIFSGGESTFTAKVNAPEYGFTSDKRLKLDPTPMGHVLKDLDELPIYSYQKTKPDGSLMSGKEYGYFAQDVAELFPHAATKDQDGWMQLKVGSMSAINTKAIQELHAKIKSLQRQIIELGGRVD